ncbi:LysR substrate-binding domain-containing protein [Pedomonas sp. V897]|uniref:LysR substrate-binding domain-containing protein n=1 Tax=Pedomonas sp. V897 TaxID=3446482 RepID=UPI003EE3A779
MAGRLPSLRGIETFVCVAELLNLRLASERLNVTVSAISYRIQALEDELGVKLFDRSQRRLRLTEEGRAFLDRLQPGLASLAEATTDTRKALARPVLRVAAPAIIHDLIIVPRLDSFLNDHPLTRIELLSGRRRAAGNDVAIVPLSPSSLRDGAEPLLDIVVTPVCSPDFLARHTIESPHDLLNLPLIDTIPSINVWKTWFRAAGIDVEQPSPALACDNHTMLYRAAAAGLGVALANPTLISNFLREGRLVRPLSFESPVLPSLGVVVSERGNMRLGRAFARWLRNELGAIVQNDSISSANFANES